MLNPWMCRAKDIMSPHVTSVKEDTPIYDAIKVLVEGHFSGLPVVDGQMRLAGVISEKDMMRLLYNFEVSHGEVPPLAKVENYMTPDVITVDHQDTLTRVCDCLLDHQFRRVPVLADGKLVGVITRADIIKYILELMKNKEASEQPLVARHIA
jgi:CBS domain-containing protein